MTAKSEDPRDDLLQRFDAAWDATMALVRERTEDELAAPLPSGWSALEMLGHLAFWTECLPPVVVGMLRGDAAAVAGWRFGSGYVPDDSQPWPRDTVHNAREAAWARSVGRDAVVSRLERAMPVARDVIASLRDDEARDARFVDYLDEAIDHVREHGSELA